MTSLKRKRFETSALPDHHANNSATSFKNPWPSAQSPTWKELLPSSFPLGFYNASLRSHPHARTMKCVKPDWGTESLSFQGLSRPDCLLGTWLGHASALVEFPCLSSDIQASEKKSLYVLFDPIFSNRAGPASTPGVGPTRLRPPPCQVADLPGVDIVCISHNHYDHLDLGSIKDVMKHFPGAKFFVPLGIKSWIVSTGVEEEAVKELDWWQDGELDLENRTNDEQKAALRISCVPAQHNSGRLGYDKDSTLWCGWVVERLVQGSAKQEEPTRKGVVYHAGDTGYRRTPRSDTPCPVFEQIGEKFGPFDLSFIPIWRGGSLGFISYWGLRLIHHEIPAVGHCSPTDAVIIHKDVKSRNTVGVHFATFIGSECEDADATSEFGEACEKSGVRGLQQQVTSEEAENGRAGTLDLGGCIAVQIR